MTSGATGWTPRTSTVFCTVIAVIAVIPCTPQRAKALRSAWIPAPPPESEPAIDSTAGTGRSGIAHHGSWRRGRSTAAAVPGARRWLSLGSSRRGPGVATDTPAHVAHQLQLGEPRHRLAHAVPGLDQRVERLAPVGHRGHERPQVAGHL